MKKTLLLALCISLLIASFTFKSHQVVQSKITNYYYFQGEKFYHSYKPDMVFVKFKQIQNAGSVEEIIGRFSEVDASKTFSYTDRAFVKLKFAMNDDAYLNLIDRIKSEPEIESAGYTFTPLNYDDGKTFYGMSDEFIIQFKNSISTEQANIINEQNDAEVIEQINVSGGLTYLMKVRE